MFQYFNDLTFHFMAPTFGTQCNFHLVIIHGMCRVAFGNEDRFTAIIGDKRVLSVAFAQESACHDLPLIIQFIMSFLCLYQKIIFYHFLNDVGAKHFQWMCSQV